MTRWKLSIWDATTSVTLGTDADVALPALVEHACEQLGHPQGALLSLISEANPHFHLQAALWNRLADLEDGVSLSFPMTPGTTTIRQTTPHARPKWVEIAVPGDEALNVLTDDLDVTESIVRDFLSLRSPSELWLGRQSSNGQFNLHFSQEVIQQLSSSETSLVG